jgi:phosphoribosyl-ATP pyrophosphohydrolase
VLDEASDLVYHLFVMLAEQDIEFNELAENLRGRHKQSKIPNSK